MATDECRGCAPGRYGAGGAKSAATAIRSAVAAVDTADWHRIKASLLVTVTTGPAGLLSRPLGQNLAIEVALPVVASHLDAAIRLTGPMVDGWGVGPEVIWARATANTRRLLRPTVHLAVVGRFDVALLVGDGWTSGVAVGPQHFLPPGWPLIGSDRPRFWWSLLSARCAVVISLGHDRPSVTGPEDSADAYRLVAALRRRTSRPLPPNLFIGRPEG